MKNNFINQVKLDGYLFDHTLTHRTTGPNSKNPGQDFINGTISIATDDSGTNVTQVVFSYVTPIYAKSGKNNQTYNVLDQIINNGATFTEVGTNATKVSVTGSIDTNDFLSRDGNMVCAKRVAGSFCNIVQSISGNPAKFEADILINATREREVEGGDDYLEIDGYCFNFRGNLLPVTLSCVNPKGIQYFESKDISKNDPLFTKVWGEIVSTVVKREETIESDWGEPQVTVSSRTFTAWNITAMKSYEAGFDDDSTITKAELEEAEKVRIEYVAAEKARQEEYRNSQNGNAGFPTAKEDKKASSPTASADYVF